MKVPRVHAVLGTSALKGSEGEAELVRMLQQHRRGRLFLTRNLSYLGLSQARAKRQKIHPRIVGWCTVQISIARCAPLMEMQTAPWELPRLPATRSGARKESQASADETEHIPLCKVANTIINPPEGWAFTDSLSKLAATGNRNVRRDPYSQFTFLSVSTPGIGFEEPEPLPLSPNVSHNNSINNSIFSSSSSGGGGGGSSNSNVGGSSSRHSSSGGSNCSSSSSPASSRSSPFTPLISSHRRHAEALAFEHNHKRMCLCKWKPPRFCKRKDCRIVASSDVFQHSQGCVCSTIYARLVGILDTSKHRVRVSGPVFEENTFVHWSLVEPANPLSRAQCVSMDFECLLCALNCRSRDGLQKHLESVHVLLRIEIKEVRFVRTEVVVYMPTSQSAAAAAKRKVSDRWMYMSPSRSGGSSQHQGQHTASASTVASDVTLFRRPFHSFLYPGAVKKPADLLYDSEDDLDAASSNYVESTKLLNETEDVSASEKLLMTEWNDFLIRRNCISNGQVALLCRQFAAEKGQLLIASYLQTAFKLHLVNLVHFHIITPEDLLDTLTILSSHT